MQKKLAEKAQKAINDRGNFDRPKVGIFSPGPLPAFERKKVYIMFSIELEVTDHFPIASTKANARDEALQRHGVEYFLMSNSL